jgi:hypothetical protein
MNKSELQSTLWLWWPFLAFTAVASLVGGVTWYLWPEAESVEIVDTGFEDMEKLTRFSEFSSAYLRANGGEEQLEALQSVMATGQMESGGQTVPFFSLKRRPDMSLMTLKMPDYDLTFVVNGEQVWQRVNVKGQEPQYELKTGAEAEALGEMGVFFDPIMRVLLFGEGSIERLVPSMWMGRPTIKIEFRTDDGQMQASAYVDIENMHPLARIEAFADGRERRVLYSDYRSVNGMQEPFHIETYLDDVLQSRVVLEKSTPNVGTVASLFQYPGPESDLALETVNQGEVQ